MLEWYLKVSVGVKMVSNSNCGCLDDVGKCMFVCGWCLTVSLGVWIVSVGV